MMKKIMIFLFLLIGELAFASQDSLLSVDTVSCHSFFQNKCSISCQFPFHNFTSYNKTGLSMKDSMPWITALLIALISAIVTWCVSMNQIRSNSRNIKLQVNAANISDKRQEWIDTLRKNVASIIKNHFLLAAKIKTGKISEFSYQDQEFKDILETITLIDLSLNPSEELSRRLMQLLQKFTENHTFTGDVETEIQSIIQVTQLILKSEWERVKKCE